MAVAWEYAWINVKVEGSVWIGKLTTPSGREDLGPCGRQDLYMTLNRLGRDGWEVVQQVANGTEYGSSAAYVYGWEWLLKRPVGQ